MQHSFCSHCGAAYSADQPWPRVCTSCGETTWRNPLPVAVVLLPVDTDAGRAVVVVRRDIEPQRGKLSLPGGFIEYGEAWRDGAVRELFEETTITADPSEVTLFDVHSAPSGTLLVFGQLPPRPVSALPPSVATDESTGFELVHGPQELAFSTHTQVLHDYFTSTPDRTSR